MHSHVTRKVAVEADSRFLGLVLGLGWVEGDRGGMVGEPAESLWWVVSRPDRDGCLPIWKRSLQCRRPALRIHRRRVVDIW